MRDRIIIIIMILIAVLSFVATAELDMMSECYAVDPPKYGDRQKAEAYRKEQVKKEVAEGKAAGCKYGKDKTTGKCYEPREGQFYRDPQTGDVKVKKIEKVNVPWK